MDRSVLYEADRYHGDPYYQGGYERSQGNGIPMADYNYDAEIRRDDGIRQRPRGDRPVSDGYYDTRQGPSYYMDEQARNSELLGNLPSRQLGAMMSKGTVRHRRHKSFHGTIRLPPGAGLDEINQVLNDDPEMHDRTGEEIEDMIRGMTTTLSRKKEIKRRISSRKKTVGRFMQFRYSCGMAWQHFQYQVAEVMYSLELWRSHLKKIEGQFGTGVTSYFIFLKWLFLINIPIFLLTLGFVVIPQILFRWYYILGGELQTRSLQEAYNHSNPSFTGEELLTGEGWFTNTEMYYGFYTNETVKLFSVIEYKMIYAYLFTCGGYYLLCLIILAQSILQSYRKYYVEGSSDLSLFLVKKVFCGWDYAITSQEAASLKHSSLYNELMEYMSVKKAQPAKTLGENCTVIWIRIVTNLIVLGLLGGSGYLVYFISREDSIQNSIPVLSKLALPLVITSINNILPLIFSIIERFEQYEKPKNELYIHMLRTMTLRAANLGVLVFFWFNRTATEEDTECWESHVGQEIYRLVIVDFIFILLYTFFFEFIRRIMSQYCCKTLERAEFGIGRNTLDLIYSQALCWLGTFYSPLLSCVVILKLWVVFYVKRISVTQNCKPSMRPWRASRSHTIFLAFLFGYFILTTVAVCCGIIFVKPSLDCGPYQGKTTTYQVVIELIDSLKGQYAWLKDAIKFISSPGFIAGLVILLCMGVYYMRIAMIGHKEMVNLLQQQLSLEGKDKNFLLNLLQQVNRRSKPRGPDTGRQSRLIQDENTSRVTSPDNYKRGEYSPGGRTFARQMMDHASRM